MFGQGGIASFSSHQLLRSTYILVINLAVGVFSSLVLVVVACLSYSAALVDLHVCVYYRTNLFLERMKLIL